jgi:hypothetical protein
MKTKTMTTPPTKKSINRSHLRLGFILITLLLACFVLSQRAQGVVPPPPGGYPNFTTAAGDHALQALTLGVGNTALGTFSLFRVTTGSFNTAVGAGSLDLNTADSNTATGAAALLFNTTGTENTANGTAALEFNDSGDRNTAVGAFALFSNTEGENNNAFGADALQNNISGSNNTAVGGAALQNSTGDYNTALGAGAGTDPAIVSNNIYIGDPGFAGDTNVISIGGIAASGTPYELTFIGGIYGSEVSTGTALPVYVDTDGHLGTTLVNASGKKVRIRTPQGAQPQANVNEFQKQQKRIAELESTVARLVATVKEQAAQIENVSAQLEVSKPAPQVVNNP